MTAALEVQELFVSYGKLEVLRGLSFELAPRDSLVVLGHNGAGKSTLIKAIFGLAVPTGGHVLIRGSDYTRTQQHALIRAGVAYVPQGDAVFRDLTVEENVMASLVAVPSANSRDVARAFDLFPMLDPLRKRRAGFLSGGERRILAMAMAAARRPRLLLLDEPSIGLSPARVDELFAMIDGWRGSEGCSVLIAEQNVLTALRWMKRALIIRAGRAHWTGSTEELTSLGEVGIAQLL